MIQIAISKEKLFPCTIKLLKNAGYTLPSKIERTLIYKLKEIELLITKDFDTPLYVEYGIADLGICGKDILLERKEINVFEIADLKYGYCKIVVACPEKNKNYTEFSTIRIGTKYPNITSEFFSGKNLPYEIIKLSGSVELACVSQLTHIIVDIVETGKTLKENGLKVFEVISNSSARLISNRASFSFKLNEIENIKRRLLNASNRL